MYYIPPDTHRAPGQSMNSTMLRYTAVLALVLAASARASVPDFRLTDSTGVTHQLYQSVSAKAIVVMVQGNGCPMVRNSLPALREVRTLYGARHVEFLLLNANLQDNADSIRLEATEFGIDFPILLDTTQEVAQSLGVVRTAEIFVIDPRGWDVVYRGPVDDRSTYERQKPAATEHYLADVLDTLIAGDRVEFVQRDAAGCLIRFGGPPASARTDIGQNEHRPE